MTKTEAIAVGAARVADAAFASAHSYLANVAESDERLRELLRDARRSWEALYEYTTKMT